MCRLITNATGRMTLQSGSSNKFDASLACTVPDVFVSVHLYPTYTNMHVFIHTRLARSLYSIYRVFSYISNESRRVSCVINNMFPYTLNTCIRTDARRITLTKCAVRVESDVGRKQSTKKKQQTKQHSWRQRFARHFCYSGCAASLSGRRNTHMLRIIIYYSRMREA